MRRRLPVFSFVVATACGSFDPADSSNGTSDGGGVDGGAGSDAGGAVADAGSAVDSGNPPGTCIPFTDGFESFMPKPGAWTLQVNAGASVTTTAGWNGRALFVHYDSVPAGNARNAFATHGFIRTNASCPLIIKLDLRARPTTDGTWLALVIQGSAGGKVTFSHQGSFWYLNAGNTRQQVPFALDNTIGHIELTLQRSGAHDLVTYTNGLIIPMTIDDPQVVIGDGVDLQLGGQVQGPASGANEAEIDDLVVSW